MHKKRFIFIDLYNLHLEIGSVLFKPQQTMKTLLGQKEREKLLGFFKKHDSKQVKHTTAEQVRRECTGPNGKIKANISEMSNLGWYERMARVCWFESKHFLLFAQEYGQFTNFVNEYLEGELSLVSLLWLQRKSFSRRLQIIIKDPKGERFRFPHDELFKKLKKVPLSKFQVAPEWKTLVTERISSQDPFPYYGLRLRPLFYEIYAELASLLNGKHKICRCAKPKCNNVVLKLRITQKFCCRQHRSCVSSTTHRKKLWKERWGL